MYDFEKDEEYKKDNIPSKSQQKKDKKIAA